MKKFLYFILCAQMCIAQEIVSENLHLYNDSIYLPGILSYPKLSGKLPLAIFIHGSGNGDRDGNQGTLVKSDHIKQLADSLNSHGIAFYRYDKRSATVENLNHFKMETFRIGDLANDADIAIQKFSKDTRFASLHLIGHSQGSLVGMLAVSEAIDSYISLAGPGTSIDKTMIRQLTAQNEDMGKVAAAYFKELKETDTIQNVNPFLLSIFAPMNQKYLKDWASLNPSEKIKELNIPTLIINGDADSQITIEDANLLSKSKPDAKLSIIKKMNHLLKTVTNYAENQRSYSDPSFPISADLIEVISEFIKTNE